MDTYQTSQEEKFAKLQLMGSLTFAKPKRYIKIPETKRQKLRTVMSLYPLAQILSRNFDNFNFTMHVACYLGFQNLSYPLLLSLLLQLLNFSKTLQKLYILIMHD